MEGVIVYDHVSESHVTFVRGGLHNVWWDPHIDYRTSLRTISNVPWHIPAREAYMEVAPVAFQLFRGCKYWRTNWVPESIIMLPNFLKFIRSVLEHQNVPCCKIIKIVMLLVYNTQHLRLLLVWPYLGIKFQSSSILCYNRGRFNSVKASIDYIIIVYLYQFWKILLSS